MKRLYISTFGIGLGHASRMVSLAKRLEGRVELAFSSYNEPAEYIRRSGFRCYPIEEIDLTWGDLGQFSLNDMILALPENSFKFFAQIGREMRVIAGYGPDLVLSDSKFSAILAAGSLGVESILILNQLRVLLSKRSAERPRWFDKVVGEVMGVGWSLAKLILIPDLPPPYTISEGNSCGVSVVGRKLRYVGFMIERPKPDREEVEKLKRMFGQRPVIFAHISGPEETKRPFIRSLIREFEKIGGYTFVVSEGRPLGSTQPRRLKENIYLYEWCPVRDELLELADALIVRGGHSTLSLAILAGKPFVTIPIEGQTEQMSNSRKAERLGSAVMLGQNDLKGLGDALEEVLGDEKRERAERLRRIALKYDGVGEVARLISEELGL